LKNIDSNDLFDNFDKFLVMEKNEEIIKKPKNIKRNLINEFI
jgi:hypothetical protein